eukprot:CFRG7629T1
MEITREPAARPGINSYVVGGTKFDIPDNYSLVKTIGQGAYGVVCSAENSSSGSTWAIKKICKAFDCITDAVRTLREIKLLRHFHHENIISIEDIFKPLSYDGSGFQDVYIVSDLMETDLHQIIASSQPLTDEHVQYFLYQILRGLKYIHSAGVLHRDLKPSNLLLNGNCDLKICDFGLARVYDPAADHEAFITQYVATRWYRAPEIILSWKQYTKAIDVWSTGCIFAEMLLRQPLFPGRDYIHQVDLIIKFVGTPTEVDVSDIKSDKARRYLRSLPVQRATNLKGLFPKAIDGALDLLKKMLTFNPRDRISVEDALAHPFLSSLHDPSDEPVSTKPFDFEWETASPLTQELLKALVFKEIVDCHPEVCSEIQNPLTHKEHSDYSVIRKAVSTAGKSLDVFEEIDVAISTASEQHVASLVDSASVSSARSSNASDYLSHSPLVQKSFSVPGLPGPQSNDIVNIQNMVSSNFETQQENQLKLQQQQQAQHQAQQQAEQQLQMEKERLILEQEQLRLEERRRQQQLYVMQIRAQEVQQQQAQQHQEQRRQQVQWQMQNEPQDLESSLGYTSNIESQMQAMQLHRQQQQMYDPIAAQQQARVVQQAQQLSQQRQAQQLAQQQEALRQQQQQQLQQQQQQQQQQRYGSIPSSWQEQLLRQDQLLQQRGNLSADEIAALESLMGDR